jgi:hypothetical protein
MKDRLTRVTFGALPDRLNVYLRFGAPRKMIRINVRCRVAYFTPGQTFCRIWWAANEYGTTRWELVVLRTESPGTWVHRLCGISPGATILLRVEGETSVKPVLRLISVIEARDLDPTRVPAAYWRMVHNRLAARVAFAPHGPGRHFEPEALAGMR